MSGDSESLRWLYVTLRLRRNGLLENVTEPPAASIRVLLRRAASETVRW